MKVSNKTSMDAKNIAQGDLLFQYLEAVAGG